MLQGEEAQSLLNEQIVIQDGGLVIQESVTCEIAPSDTNIIQESADGTSLKVIAEGIHVGITKNFHNFTETELKKALKTWTNPFPRPILREHVMSIGFFGGSPDDVTPLGRVVEAKLAPSTIKQTQGTLGHLLTLQVSDSDAMERIKDQRYLTLSVGARVGAAHCSICDHNFLGSGDFCDHDRGKKYKGKVATWILKDIQFLEVSFVNNPADTSAQVIGIEEAEESVGEGVQMGMPNETPNILENVDTLLENEQTTEDESEETTDDTQTTEEDDANESESTDEAATTEESEENVSVNMEQFLALQEQVQILESTLSGLMTNMESLQEKFDEFTESTLSVIGEAEDVQGRILKQNVEMARLAKVQMAERMADLMVLSGEKTVEEWESIYENAMTTPSKDVVASIQDALKQMMKKPRKITYVDPVSLATKTKTDETDDTSTDSPVQDETEVSEEEYMSTIINGLTAAINRNRK